MYGMAEFCKDMFLSQAQLLPNTDSVAAITAITTIGTANNATAVKVVIRVGLVNWFPQAPREGLCIKAYILQVQDLHDNNWIQGSRSHFI